MIPNAAVSPLLGQTELTIQREQALSRLRGRAAQASAAAVQQVTPVLAASATAAPTPAANPFAAAMQAPVLPPTTAQHLCTDQANVVRMRNHYGSQLLSVGGRFHYWTGTHWEPNDNAAARLVATLSRVIGVEVQKAVRVVRRVKKAYPAAATALAQHPYATVAHSQTKGVPLLAAAIAKRDALRAWSQQSEMAARQAACLGMLQKMIEVPADRLDRNPAYLNCRNGTVDLRTGALLPHDPADYITHCAPVEFDPTAQAPRFEQFLQEIFDRDQSVVDFMQRWFGYCGTGETREQKFLIHVGNGGNGKGVLLETLSKVLGDYARAAPPGFFTDDDQSRAQARNAEMFGRRLVTASETDERAALNEAFVKAATGGDRLIGKFLYHDPFQFSPIHKLQLFTNGLPSVAGTDRGIWRRIALVKYPHTWGSAADVASGQAEHEENCSLVSQLEAELPGVLAWVVEGAVEWYRAGLQVPAIVARNTEAFRSEQDRAEQFIKECCGVAPAKWVAVGDLYFAYQHWCKESGYRALGKGKFAQQLPRLVAQFARERRHNKEGYAGLDLDSSSVSSNKTVSQNESAKT